MPTPEIAPEDVLAFWFPESAEPDPAEHLALWMWRMRGGRMMPSSQGSAT